MVTATDCGEMRDEIRRNHAITVERLDEIKSDVTRLCALRTADVERMDRAAPEETHQRLLVMESRFNEHMKAGRWIAGISLTAFLAWVGIALKTALDYLFKSKG